MSSAGWYPDPGGSPGQYRYWDGRTWSQTTSPFPGGNAPQQQPSVGRGAVGWIVVAIVGVVAVSLVVWFMFFRTTSIPVPAPDTNSARPTVTGWDETQPTTQPPIEGPTGGTLIQCPVNDTSKVNSYPNDGWVHGGGLKFKKVPGWRDERVHMGWVYDMHSQTDVVEQGWFSMVGVGSLSTVDGFEEPKLSAFQVMSCFSTSTYYQGYIGRTDLISEAVTINGRPGWHLRSAVLVEMARLPHIEGDWVDIIVVDTGEPGALGIFISSVTINDTNRRKLVDDAMDSLTTD